MQNRKTIPIWGEHLYQLIPSLRKADIWFKVEHIPDTQDYDPLQKGARFLDLG